MTEYYFTTPLDEKDIRKLKIRDVVYISGTIITARDQAYKRILEYNFHGKTLPLDIVDGVIYHCGPLVRKKFDLLQIISAGPTTSARLEEMNYEFIKNTGVRIIIGKGGMKTGGGVSTSDALRQFGCVYGTVTGGTGVYLAQKIKRIKSVEWQDLGDPEAMWVFEVENFGPVLITMDTKEQNLHQIVEEKVLGKKIHIYSDLNID